MVSHPPGNQDGPSPSDAATQRSPPFPSRGFWENLTLLLIGFVLTGVVGAFLSFWFQREMARREAYLIAEQSDLAQSIDAFRTVSDEVGKRQFRMNRLVQALTGVAPENTRNDRARDYKEIFVEWNEQLGRNTALYNFYFHDDAAADRVCASLLSITRRFENMHKNQLEPILEGTPGNLQQLRDDTLKLGDCIATFDQSMLSSIENKRQKYLAAVGD
ncbi:MAG TPA: hypothetical protein VGG48_02315 [Rhizomicrobium sp.]|jgi:hypothetical protein